MIKYLIAIKTKVLIMTGEIYKGDSQAVINLFTATILSESLFKNYYVDNS